MKKHAGPDSVPLHSEYDLENFINNFDASVVGKLFFFGFFYTMPWNTWFWLASWDIVFMIISHYLTI